MLSVLTSLVSSLLYYHLHGASHIVPGTGCGHMQASLKPQCWLQSVVWRRLAPYMKRFSVFPLIIFGVESSNCALTNVPEVVDPRPSLLVNV